ncbi:hypothetical protein [Rhodococcus erythropolis]|uniref:hypothetical protein n=1 Tax=Rhodococcus erythropolis TaxID=1833 RepID=UPI00083F515F|nr:hypothetical protein [Rhodococcus erythropolis]
MSATEHDIVTRLARNPLFQLTVNDDSGPAKLLYWLLKIQERTDSPQPFTELSKAFYLDPMYSHPMQLEHHGLDLFVDGGLGAYKLGVLIRIDSRPTAAQLNSIFTKLPPRLQDDDHKYVVISLIPPSTQLPEPWQHIDYADLYEPLAEFAAILRDRDQKFESAMVEEFADLVYLIGAIRHPYALGVEPDSPITLSDHAKYDLDSARASILFRRLRMYCYGESLMQSIQRNIAVDLSGIREFIEYVVPAKSGELSFGWRFQSRSVQLFATFDQHASLTHDAQKSYAERQLEDYFEPRRPNLAEQYLSKYSGKQKWHTRDRNTVYWYRLAYRDLHFSMLTEVLAELSHHVEAYAAQH